jgi:pyrroline-5-carboxylate reductase
MKIRIIGCGAMGSAIGQTLKEAGQEISLYDKHGERADSLSRAIGAPQCQSPLENLDSGDAILLAVKPQDFDQVIGELKGFTEGLIVSILTGVSLARLKQAFPECTVLRMMPNLAVRYGDGIVALADDPELTPFKKRIEELFVSLGLLRWMSETHFDAVTALSGSGPAFIFVLVEAMVDAAIAMGLSSDMGYDLIKHMIGGALTMLYESPESPSELRWKVSSPNGTTIAGIRAMEKHGVRSGIIETFLAACSRAKEL